MLIFNKEHEGIIYLLSVDDKLSKLIKAVGDITLDLSEDYFVSLAESIIGQQLSIKAAATIWRRVVELLGDITPDNILGVSDEDLRKVGISRPKISYIRDLAEKALSGKINFSELDRLSDGEVVKLLTEVKGIGRWTAEMFLIFSLGRLDVMAYDDIGLQRSFKWLLGLDDFPGKEYMEEYCSKWKPYCSIASLYLWEIINRGIINNYKSFDEFLLSNSL